VVEAALPSGSLITAGTAAEQGREVFALPWSVFHPGGGGCLRLIRDGAKMVLTLEDILEELGPMYTLQQELLPRMEGEHTALPVLDAAARRVLDLVGSEACSVDDLARCSGQPVPELLARLSELEIAGLVRRCDGGYTRGD
jgi:DNA processing protein